MSAYPARTARDAASLIRRLLKLNDVYEATSIIHQVQATSRLPIHTLIHGLIRAEKPRVDEAKSVLVSSVYSQGTRLRRKTFLATFNASLTDLSSNPYTPNHRLPDISRPTVLTLNPKRADHRINNALSLFFLARQQMYPRTLTMYKNLIDALLHHKNYIDAALVFEMMVNDHYLLKTLPDYFVNQPLKAKVRHNLRVRYDYLLAENVFPNSDILNSICASLRTQLARGRNYPLNRTMVSCLQSATILATLLDRRRLPFGDIGQLIDVLWKLPHVQFENNGLLLRDQIRSGMVWVDMGTEQTLIKASTYGRAVLTSLCENLPSPPSSINPMSETTPRELLPPLDSESYNNLLRVALHVWKRPKLARRVLIHLVEDRGLPLDPSICRTLSRNTSSFKLMMEGVTVVDPQVILTKAASFSPQVSPQTWT